MSDDTIFREVDEEVRQAELKKLWDRYGWLVVGAAIALVLGVAGVKAYKAWRISGIQESGGQYEQALELIHSGKTEEAGNTLATLASDGKGGYRVLARLRGADLGKGDAATKVAAYDSIAEDSGVDDPIRNLARLRAALLRVDDADQAEMAKRLKGLDQPLSPWRHNANELLGLSAWKAKDYKKAQEYFLAILADTAAPRTVRARAGQMRALLEPLLAGDK